MGNVTTMVVFVWTINILVFLSQASMLAINPDSIQFYKSEGTIINQYSTGGNVTMPDSNQVATELNPASSSELQETEGGTGIFFIDAIASVKTWVQGRLSYFAAIVLGPYNLLNSMGLPPNFVGPISLLWYGVSILLLILVIFGRQN